ncbi:MAG: hypothetical protein M3Q07_03125 [Pseudobdellovibrionaceae bacterium]|nr:hypothetical protein [Pseudobdellovibrionaceae bacterium]
MVIPLEAFLPFCIFLLVVARRVTHGRANPFAIPVFDVVAKSTVFEAADCFIVLELKKIITMGDAAGCIADLRAWCLIVRAHKNSRLGFTFLSATRCFGNECRASSRHEG